MTPVRPAGVRASGWGWRHAGRRLPAVLDLDLAIAPGERVLLLGASGAGKSTLLAGLAGLLGSAEDGEQTGAIEVDGVPAHLARGSAGLVLQDPDAQVVLSRVGDDVAFGCENLGVPRDEIWARVGAALEAVGLHLPLDRSTSALSGGQKQRLALAGVIAMRPGLLLLDEPTANLDPVGVQEVREAVGRVLDATGATFVVVEHRVATWADLVDRAVVLGPAGLIDDGPVDRVLADRDGALGDAGVWLPGRIVRPPAPVRPGRERLLIADGLAVGRDRRPVRSGVSLEVAAGAALALVGENGAGKSTLALTLGGLLPPVGGVLRAEPALARGAGPTPHRWRSRHLLDRLGTVFQAPEHQLLATTVRAELEVGPRALGLPADEVGRRVEALLERLGLAALARANPFTLSGGEQRRLSVATALATRPTVLLLDEPTFGQDARTWAALVDLVAELLRGGTAVVTATHDRDFVAAIGAAPLVVAADAQVVA